MAELVVVGSMNMDMVIKTPRMPVPGETLRGEDVKTIPGGKGANQAAAAANLGSAVAMIGKVGNDTFGPALIENLASFHVDTTAVTTASSSTGIAMIMVDPQGQNSILLSPGANDRLTPANVADQEALIAQAKMILLQFEIPFETTGAAIKLAKKHGVRVILNPAPAREINPELFPMIDFLVPNESELALLTGMSVTDFVTAKQAADTLIAKGVGNIIVTLGKKGALLIHQNQAVEVPAPEVEVVDTTAAGDAFIGGFAHRLNQDASLEEAVRYGCTTGSLAVTNFGAQSSLPNKKEVEDFLKHS